MLLQFFRAIATGDTAGLTALFAPDAVVLSDSDGKARAARRPDHRHGLRGKFLGHLQAETTRDLGDQAQQRGRRFLGQAALRQIAERTRDGLSQGHAHGKIA